MNQTAKELGDDLASGMEFSQALARMEQRREELSDRAVRFLDEVLFPHQKEALEEAVTALLASSYGPFSVLLPVADAEPLAEIQRRRLIESWQRRIQQLKDDLVEHEVEMLNRQIEALSPENQRRVRDAIGERPKYLVPSPLWADHRVSPSHINSQ